MKNFMIVTLSALALVPLASGMGASPIGKVLDMLSDLQAKIIAEGEKAQKVYAEFAEWCEDTSKDLAFSITTGKNEIADLQATIEKETSMMSSTSSKIDELSGSIATDEADLNAATTIRDQEAADFAAEKKELAEIIDTLERAIAILEREMAKGGASMMQLKSANSLTDAFKIMVQASVLNSADADRLTALVQTTQKAEDADDDMGAGAPDAAVYENQSGGIVETLQNLLEKAEAQLDAAEKKETSAIHNFEMLKQSLEDSVKFANKDMAEAKATLAGCQGAKGTADGDLSVTSKDLASDEQSLADLHHECMSKSEDFEAATRSRAEELKALAEAKKVLEETTGAADKIAYGLLQVARSQLSSRTDLANFEAIRLIRALAKKNDSPALAQLASRMAAAMSASRRAGDDPFGKVKGLISDMISRLEADASADATEKSYCDKELAESSAKRDDRTATVAKLSTKIDQMSAKSAQLKEEVAALQKALAGLARTQAEMDAARQEEHALFQTTKADTSNGLEGVKLALKILRDYYSKEDKAHEAAEGAGQGIIGLLEVCEADFSKGLAEAETAEQAAAASHEQTTKQNSIEKTIKDQDVKYKTKESKALDKAIAEASSDRTGVQEELDAVLQYLTQLTKRCVAKPETYSERASRRAAEIAGLKEALDILENETMLLQHGVRRSLRKGRQ